MIPLLPEGQLVLNEVIDTWVLGQLEGTPLWAADLITALPVDYAKPDGQMKNAMRAVDRSLQRLKRAGKIRLAEGPGRPKWTLIQ